MAKSKATGILVHQLIAKVLIDLQSSNVILALASQPLPTRHFQIGEPVRIGHLSNVVIEQVYYDGKAYLYSCDNIKDSSTRQYNWDWWYKIFHINNDLMPPLFVPRHRDYPIRSADIDSIIHLMESDGIVCNPTYQRGYVWSEQNKDALIESIFDRVDIGSFMFVRNHGYNYDDNHDKTKYITLDQREIFIEKCNDYSVELIDGQQRLTTIFDFLLNRRPYKQHYFHDLCIKDQREFRSTAVGYRLINREDISEKEILRLFLQVNRGVPQTAEHIAKVQSLYDGMA